MFLHKEASCSLQPVSKLLKITEGLGIRNEVAVAEFRVMPVAASDVDVG